MPLAAPFQTVRSSSLRHLFPLLLVAAAGNASAADINTVFRLSQSEFRLLSEDLGAALSFKPLIPAESMGIVGFDLGLAVTATELKHPELLSKAANNVSVATTVPIPSVRVHKGLPLNIDVGLSYSYLPDTSLKFFGGEARWAVLPGSTVLPAVAIRAAYTQTSGVEQLKVSTTSADVSVSKGFALLTPYAGAGQVWIKSAPIEGIGLQEESFTQTKFFVGMNINVGFNLAVEYDNTGGISSYGVKGGFRF